MGRVATAEGATADLDRFSGNHCGRRGATAGDTKMSQTIAESWIEEGMEKGMKKGKLIASHGILMRQGRKRFGEPDKATVAALNAITDEKRLVELSERLL